MKKINLGTKSLGGALKISKAQKTTLVIVGATAVVVGAGLVLIIDFIKFMNFKSMVITKQDESIAGYSSTIKNSGACVAPRSRDGIYTEEELKRCNPSTITTDQVQGSLRANIMDNATTNLNFESVGRATLGACINPDTEAPYSYKELTELYNDAKTSEDKRLYKYAIRICSTLRVIPDALPTSKNTEALLASLNQIYLASNWKPTSIAPSGGGSSKSNFKGLVAIPVAFNMNNAHVDSVKMFLGNLSKSIRFFNITSMKLATNKGGDTVDVSSSAEAYYAAEMKSSEQTNTLTANGGKKK